MEKEEINSLIEKYIRGFATQEERTRLLHWYSTHEDQEVQWILADQYEEQQLKNRLFQQIEMHTHPVSAPAERRLIFLKRPWFKVAAAIFVVLSASLWLINSNLQRKQVLVNTVKNKPIRPGRHTAILTLSDGSVVNLDDSKLGELASQSGVSIRKTDKGELEYTVKNVEGKPGASTSYNTISTPKGGRYQINLPDGTKVWLNAASSLKFPTIFQGNERRVELAGEGYFEVAKNAHQPFKVFSQSAPGTSQEIEVLGTHFNADTYGDDNNTIKTTLLEGSVRISTSINKKATTLQPGQQSSLQGARLQVEKVDLEEVMAWKNGYFIFNDEDIKIVMAKISRWYDMEVVYAKEIKDIKIGGSISQSKSLEEVLDLLSLTGKLNFKIVERRIIVTP